MSEVQGKVTGTNPKKQTVMIWCCYDCGKELGQSGLTARNCIRKGEKRQVCQFCLEKQGKEADHEFKAFEEKKNGDLAGDNR